MAPTASAGDASGRRKVLVAVVVTAAIAGALVGGIVYAWQEQKIRILRDQLSALKKEAGASRKIQAARKQTCFDSDGEQGEGAIFVKGSVTCTDASGVKTTVYDECTGSKKQVMEMWVYESPAGSGNYVMGTMVFDCPRRGCFEGACLP